MNRRHFLTGVAAGVATALAGPGSEKLFFFGEDTTEIISGVTGPFRMRSASAVWNIKPTVGEFTKNMGLRNHIALAQEAYDRMFLSNPLERITPLFKEPK